MSNFARYGLRYGGLGIGLAGLVLVVLLAAGKGSTRKQAPAADEDGISAA